MLSIEQLATAIDCEGYLGINRMMSESNNGKYSFSARIGLGMIHPAIPTALKETFGSTVRLERNVRGNYSMYRWTVVGNKMIKTILETLLPHLVVKQEQAKNLLAFIEYSDSFPLVRKGKKGWTKNTDVDVMTTYWLTAKALNHPAPATTKRENPVMGSDSLNSQETVREELEEVLPLV
jgi:hypothetical protein